MLLEEIVLKAESNGVFYDVAYSPVFTYQVNGIEILNTSLSFTPYCNNLGNVYGCTNENYLEYNPLANIYDGSCATIVVYGCTDILYIEYSITANTDNESCNSLIVEGCTNANYLEFNQAANLDD